MLHFVERARSHSFALETSTENRSKGLSHCKGCLSNCLWPGPIACGFSEHSITLSKKDLQYLNNASEFYFGTFTGDICAEDATWTLSNKIPEFLRSEVASAIKP